MSAAGNIAVSGTHAPWSRPRVGIWMTGSLSGMSAATVAASSGAAGASYCIR